MTEFEKLETLIVTLSGFTAYITLNRPEVKNAMTFKMVEEIISVFESLRGLRHIRAVVLSGAGGTFCAGADLNEMSANAVPDDKQRNNLDVMLRTINEADQIVIARVEGAALGGGLGLICVSDIAIVAEDAKLGLPEVRLGISPAFISPYVIQRIGLAKTRQLMLTGRRFDGRTAYEYGFAQISCPAEDLDHCVEIELDEIRQCAPGAIAATKALIFAVYNTPTTETVAYRAELLNKLRRGEEAQEGMQAFLNKRPPKWASGEDVG